MHKTFINLMQFFIQNLQVIGTLPWAEYVRGAFFPDEEGGNATYRFGGTNYFQRILNMISHNSGSGTTGGLK